MTASVIKHINEQRPDVDVYVRNSRMTNLIEGILIGSDIKMKISHGGKHTTYRTGHLSYPILESRADGAPHKHLIASMIDQVNERCRLGLDYDPECLAKYVGIEADLDLPEKYVLMVSCGKSINPGGKEPGYEFFSGIADKVKRRGHSIIQVGAIGDPLLPQAEQGYFQVSAQELARLMKGCRFFVGMVNGLTHFAGHNGVHALCFYKGLEKPVYTRYPKQHGICLD